MNFQSPGESPADYRATPIPPPPPLLPLSTLPEVKPGGQFTASPVRKWKFTWVKIIPIVLIIGAIGELRGPGYMTDTAGMYGYYVGVILIIALSIWWFCRKSIVKS